MPVFMPAKRDVTDLINEVAEKYHGELVDHGVTVSALMVHPSEGDESGEPVLKLRGEFAAATIKPTKYKARVKGAADAEMEIDWITWNGLSQAERVALIDHELFHLVIAKDKDDNAKLDDHMRPVLKTRLHDVVIGGFRAIIERHKAAALEFQILQSLGHEYRQAIFSWGDDSVPADDPPGNVFGGAA